ncbi:hypothetical protein AOLI_G00178080 [Acnodon oligacanthus]
MALQKGNWQFFMAEMERRSAGLPDPEVADVDVAYAAYCKVILRAAKHNIPRDYNKNYIPGWDEECSCLLCQCQQASSRDEMEATATTLLQKLDDTQRTRWTEVVEYIDFTHSSRKAWQTINLLLGEEQHPAASADANLSGDFTVAELSAAINKLKPGKSPGQDNIYPEFVIHQSDKTSRWLCSFFSACFQRIKLPKIWHRASVIALPKPNSPTKDPKSYRSISLLCEPYKILERLIHSRTEPVVDPQLPSQQACFRRGRSTVDQVTLLTQDIEDSLQDIEKTGVVFLDLTATYDTSQAADLTQRSRSTSRPSRSIPTLAVEFPFPEPCVNLKNLSKSIAVPQ